MIASKYCCALVSTEFFSQVRGAPVQGFLQGRSTRGRGRGRSVRMRLIFASYVTSKYRFWFDEDNMHAVADAACMHA